MSVRIHKDKNDDLGMLQMQILWFLEREEMHGYALMKKLDGIKKTKIEQGTLYPTLKKLEHEGYIRVRKRGDRKRKIYELTSAGKTVMRKNCEDFIFTFSDIFNAYKCKHCPVKNCRMRKE